MVTLLFGHWVADFLFQTEAMALNKSSSLKWLAFHILVYTAVLAVFCLWLLHWQDALYFAAINGLLHGLTDLLTSRLTALYKNNRRIFFLIIGLDQFIHSATLIISFGYFIPVSSVVP
ncbi:MAG: DUF3307 domain-containing protein [Flammeovirgaceae bacterium]|nr:MAG: DUF3307 domain-containing protein [Flammeovirgaceae bacterium]